MTHTELKKNALIKISESYFSLLMNINKLNDSIINQGLKEGISKFLSNAYIAEMGGSKYAIGDYYSKEAYRRHLSKIKNKDLVFEHMIPKNIFQKRFEEMARSNTLELKDITEVLNKYWHIAIITKEENSRLSQKRNMPDEWDEIDIHARYSLTNIELIPR